ncbi:hypothetical protein FDP41_003364 [Naegleria fowleri]|uniref:RWP-RK domain-containing protein n=1 Tax=Naegleria fowleri TaxID=5763 RepID=A0A6A5BRQ6_NAEFO|nr:uncharacterized protein FDP41_003364 [Naegleria fowleri]KAF0977372.1 hypothetical protein FDP41_003364 [Naegleria fowleri]
MAVKPLPHNEQQQKAMLPSKRKTFESEGKFFYEVSNSSSHHHSSRYSSTTTITTTTTISTEKMQQNMQHGAKFEGKRKFEGIVKQQRTSPILPSASCRLQVSLEEMSKYFHSPQSIAARMLGVSVSTLKRRYKEVSNGNRWPYSKMSLNEKKKSLWFYINEEDESETTISNECHLVLQKAFQNCTLPPSFYFSDKRKKITFLKYRPSTDNSQEKR